MSGEQFSLVWNSFPTNLAAGLYTLLTDEQLVDVTLAAEGKTLRAHKLILSVCSTYFKELFKMNPCKHPIVILKDVNYHDLYAMLHFMYQGEVNIKQEDLSSFLKVAETLQVKGLTKDKNEKDDQLIMEQTTLRVQVNQHENENEPKNCMEVDTPVGSDTKIESPKVIEDEKSVPMEEKLSAISEYNETLDLRCDSLALETNKPEPESQKHIESRDEQENTSTEPDSITQEILRNRSEDLSEQMSNTVEEPLDYTSDIGRLSKTKSEPPDYTSETEFTVECNKTYATQEYPTDIRDSDLRVDNNSTGNDCLQNSVELAYTLRNQDKPIALCHLEGPFDRDYNQYQNITNCNKGRRTVKGITGSSLPLETTLRVVSELGPTLRIERGKAIRMYSCPWCLRHFTRKENLKLHVRYIHGPLESLTCKLCGNKYKNSNSLRVHSYLYHNTKKNKRGKRPIVNM